MKKYNYIRLSKTKKLRYMGNFFKKKLYIIFLPGFMSNIEGEKPKSFKKYAVRKKDYESQREKYEKIKHYCELALELKCGSH